MLHDGLRRRKKGWDEYQKGGSKSAAKMKTRARGRDEKRKKKKGLERGGGRECQIVPRLFRKKHRRQAVAPDAKKKNRDLFLGSRRGKGKPQVRVGKNQSHHIGSASEKKGEREGGAEVPQGP